LWNFFDFQSKFDITTLMKPYNGGLSKTSIHATRLNMLSNIFPNIFN
jgi:hypothetical protein